MGVTNAWAGAGIFYGQINLEKDGGEYIAHTDNYSTAFALGKIQNLSIKATYSKVWRNDGGDITSTTLCYKLYSSTKEFIPETSVGMGWLKNFDNSNDQEWGKEGINSNLTSNLVPGDSYTLEFWFKANGKESSSSGNTTFWLSNSGGNYKVTFTYAPTFTITLDNQGATTPGAASVTATYNAAMPSIANNLPKKTGYDFGGYFTEPNGNGTQYYHGTGNGARKWNIAENTTLYAYWKPKTCTIIFNLNNGEGGKTSDLTATYAQPMPTPITIPTRTGYTFSGYFDAKTGGNQYYNADGTSARNWDKENGQQTLYAQWRPNVSITGTYHFFPGERINLNIATPDDGVNFSYQWQKLVGSVWTDIPGATATTYTKAETTKADAGHYRCVVSASGYTNAIADYNVKCLQLNVYYNDHSFAFTTPLEKVDATASISVDLQNANYQYYFEITDGCENFYGFNGDIHSVWYENVELNAMNSSTHCGLQTTKFGTYIFTVDHSYLTDDAKSYPIVSVTYPPAFQAADKVIYLDNNVLNWTNSNNAEGKNKIYYRIGRSDYNSKTAMTKVPGTANLYKVTTGEYNNFEVWHIANNGCWSEDHSIFKTKTGDEWAATEATAFETLPVTLEAVTVTPTTLRSVGGDENNNNCKFYNYDITEGMKTWNATVNSTTNGTVTVKYTHHDGMVVNDFTLGSRSLAHTCRLTINATPVEGYRLATLTVNGQPFTSGEKHTLTADATIEATFTINTYTATWKLNGGQWQGGGTDDIVNNHNYGEEVTRPVDPSRTGYTFTGWSPAEIPTTMPAENLEFTAQWTPTPYTITWKLGGIEYATSTVSIENPLSTTPENPSDGELGCCADKFMGWSSQQSPSAGDIFTKDNIPSNVTTAKTYYAVFATAAQGVGTSVADFSEMGYENGTAVTDPIILGDGEGHGDATITLAKAQSSSNAPTYYTDGEAVRIYAGGTITIASTYAGANIKNVLFTFASNDVEGENTISALEGTYDVRTWTGDANSVTFTIGGTTGHRNIASIQVTTGVTGSQYTNYVTRCELSGNASLGTGTIKYANEGTAIVVNCGKLSSKNSAAVLTFLDAHDLTCPITLTATEGFVLSTNQEGDTYAQTIKITPYKSGDKKGKLKNVYVRAEAAIGISGSMSGTITITGGEITDQSIAVSANVNCQGYTLTLTDHLGNPIATRQHYEGDIIEEEPAAPEKDNCSKEYTFDGWSEAPVEYGTMVYNKVSFPYTMPAQDVTLYPVYICSKDYHRVTSDLGTENWAGDYLIAYSNEVFANGSEGGESGIGLRNNSVNLSTNINGDVIPYEIGFNYYVTLVSHNKGYLLRTQDEIYNYYTNVNNDNEISTSTSESTAGKYALNIKFESADDIKLCLSGAAEGSVFGYRGGYFRYFILDTRAAIHLYKKNLYTSSLICEDVTAENACVTSTAGQTVKVNIPATMSNISIERDRSLTVESDHNDFAATITKTSETTYNVAVSYTPSAEDNTDGTETATITIKVNNIPVTTFQVTGRHLPENFVIAAKWGDNWYALPANMDSQSSTEGLLIEVDNPADPTKAIAAPSNTQYALKSVNSGKFANQGERLVFVGNEEKTLYNAEGTSIQVYAKYENYDDDRYEWVPTTIDLKDYTLTSAYIYPKDDDEARTVSLDAHGVFGTLLQNKSYEGMVRLLPVDNFYKPVELQVVEWKANSVSIMYTGAGTKATTKVGNKDEGDVQLLSDKKIKIDHAVYTLATSDLTAATNQVLTISIKDDAENTIGTLKLTIPWIVSGPELSTSRVASEVAQATDIVVLDGATLTADDTKYTYNDVVVYPGGKLMIGVDGKLGMYSLTLRLGSSWGAAKYEHKYPEFVLNTKDAYTNTSGKINLDYVTTKEQYYTFVAPFEVKTKDIKYPVDIYGSNVESANKGSFEFQYYDGAARAEGKTGWTVVPEGDDGADLEAGQGYTFLGMPKKINGNRQKYGIHRIPMKVSATEAQNHETTNQTVPLSVHLSTKNNNSGWNLIGNPYMSTIGGLTNEDIQVGELVHTTDANGNWTGGWHWDDPTNGQRFLVIPSNDGQSYEAEQASNATLPAFKNFFVQISNEGANALSIPVANRVEKSLAPARYAEEQPEKDVEVAIVLEQDEAHVDQMDFLINNIYTEDFERDADFTKMMNATNLNLYGVHPYDNLSFVAIDNNTARGSVAIGYQVPQAGEYILRMSDKPYVMFDKIEALYVTDHEMSPEVTTDIMSEPYRFTVANAETNHTRFTVSVIQKVEEDDGGGDVGTGVDNTTNSNTPCKFIYQDKMYILLNGVIYDAMGKQVQTINK
jgi:uncharacterized repeat protein (TIGR02543 family)